jgi:hypothetical protein
MRKFRVRLAGSFYSFELYNAAGAEVHDLMAAVDCAEEQYGDEWREVYNGVENAYRSECPACNS